MNANTKGAINPAPSHPWRRQGFNVLKLRAARKEAKRRYERGELHREWERDASRRKAGIPLDAPVMSRVECLAKANAARLGKAAQVDSNDND